MSALHPDPTQLLKDWLDQPEVKAKFQAVSDRAMAAVWEDTQLRVPRTTEEKTDEFTLWLAGHRERYLEFLHQEFEKEFPGIGKHLEDPYDLWRMVVQGVWNMIATELVCYAIRGIAFSWVRDRYVETIYPGVPDFREGIWDVPLLQKTELGSEPIGNFTFDGSGNFLVVEATISPREPRQRLPHLASRRMVA
ncbi:hypothetical protein [Armatimonas sp.]|uniref:hypothetical protein n=1 Tax=Armatimonas sp. TaxID=1872638 RepID=UPI00286A614B|nr:hypothetical protein [Armatimonas sp.]